MYDYAVLQITGISARKQCECEFFIINNLPTQLEHAFQTAQSASGGLSREQGTE